MQINLMRGVMRGMTFFEGVRLFGYYALLAMSFLTMFIFWIFIFMYFEPFRAMSLLIIKFIQLALLMLVFGLTFRAFLDIIYLYLYKKELAKYKIELQKTINKHQKRIINKITQSQNGNKKRSTSKK